MLIFLRRKGGGGGHVTNALAILPLCGGRRRGGAFLLQLQTADFHGVADQKPSSLPQCSNYFYQPKGRQIYIACEIYRCQNQHFSSRIWKADKGGGGGGVVRICHHHIFILEWLEYGSQMLET